MKILMVSAVVAISAIIGAFWAFALNTNILTGLIAGAIIGIPLGLAARFLQKAFSEMSSTTIRTITGLLIVPSLLLYLIAGFAVGLIMWLIRVIIF